MSFNHNFVFPKLHSQGNFDYHFVGRGSYGFGSANPLRFKDKSEYAYGIILTVHPVKDRTVDDQKAWVAEDFAHEFRGHVLRNLVDHHSDKGGHCTMTTRPSVDDFLNIAKTRKSGDYFCDSCNVGYGK